MIRLCNRTKHANLSTAMHRPVNHHTINTSRKKKNMMIKKVKNFIKVKNSKKAKKKLIH